MSNAKGIGGAGCCCGGCWSPPSDARAASTADVIEVQHYCCRCIPRFICVSLTSSGSYDFSSVLLPRYCGSAIPGESPYRGDAIQFRGDIYWDNELVTINVRLALVYEQCFLFWEIPGRAESGYRPINGEIKSSYDCGAGQRRAACVNFGGEWDLGDRTLTIAPPQMLDISGLIKCGGCKCMCKCLCMSIYSRSSTGDFTLYGSNEVVCAEVSEAEFLNCDESLSEITRTAKWELDGWRVQLEGGDGGPFSTRTVNSGVERPLTCDLDRVLRFADGDEHTIDMGSACGGTSTWQVQDADAALQWVMISDDCEGGGVPVAPTSDPSEAGLEATTACDCGPVGAYIDVEYGSSTDPSHGVPISFAWVGRSTGTDSQIDFYLWNWGESEWQSVGVVGGRPAGSMINRRFGKDIDPEYIGTGPNLNKVRVRLVVSQADTLYTDMLRIRTTRCCKLKLYPKAGVIPGSGLSELDLSVEGNCPSVFKFWNFTDQNEVEWFVSVDCSWCNGTCGGTALTTCCPRPLSRTLFAEVEIDCPSCVSPFVVVLNNTSSNMWDGEGIHCNQPFPITLACSGPDSWSISAEGAGACRFAGILESSSCEPLNIVFVGQFQGGIGCCGVGSMTTTTPIRITIFE